MRRYLLVVTGFTAQQGLQFNRSTPLAHLISRATITTLQHDVSNGGRRGHTFTYVPQSPECTIARWG